MTGRFLLWRYYHRRLSTIASARRISSFSPPFSSFHDTRREFFHKAALMEITFDSIRLDARFRNFMHGRKVSIPSARFWLFLVRGQKTSPPRRREREKEIQASVNRRREGWWGTIILRLHGGGVNTSAATLDRKPRVDIRRVIIASKAAIRFRANGRRGVDASTTTSCTSRGAACTPGYLCTCISYVRITSYMALQQFRRANAKAPSPSPGSGEVETVMRTPAVTSCALRVH